MSGALTRDRRHGGERRERKRPGRLPPLLVPALVAVSLGGVFALAQSAVVGSMDGLLPDARKISAYNRPGTLTVLDTNGQVVFKQGPATREKVTDGKMPLLIQRAFIAAEDRRFYQHEGIDLVGIGRALVRNVSQGSVEEGASTITQQLARMVFLSQDRTILRKLKEAALAGKIERQLSKAEILEQYLNLVYLGSSAYGVSDAARVYFSKTPDQLTLPEAAMIAGLPPAPSVYSPLINPDLALQRRSVVLRRMREAGFIDDAQLESAQAAPLGLKPAEPKYYLNPAPWYISWMEQELTKVLTKEQLEVGGLTVKSGLNKAWQEKAQATINANAGGGLQGALVAMEPGTGLVRAMVGGTDWSRSQFNRATQALRSPGSTFKLFTYTAALKYGMLPEDTVSARERCYTYTTVFCIKGPGGRITLLSAVTNSINSAAVATAEKVGFPRVIGVARDLGITGEIGEYPSMVLGANEKTVLEMTAAYAAINNRGLFAAPTPFEEIYGPDGELIWSRRVDGKRPKRAVSSDVADAMTWMLQRVVNEGTGRNAALGDRPVAGKTGTAEGARDLWFIGSIPQLTTAIWFGYDQNWKTGSSSAQAASAWYGFMNGIVKDLPVRQFPARPELTGKFIPYVPAKTKTKEGAPAGSQAPVAPEERWEPPVETLPPAANRDGGTQQPENRPWRPPEEEQMRHQIPESEGGNWKQAPEPSRRDAAPAREAATPPPAEPAPPAPAASAPQVPAAPPPAAPAPLLTPPPPVTAPPPP